MDDERSVARMLQDLRLARGLTQAELAERAGLSARAISDLERGLRRTPRRDTVALLTAALELSAEERDVLDGAIGSRAWGGARRFISHSGRRNAGRAAAPCGRVACPADLVHRARAGERGSLRPAPR